METKDTNRRAGLEPVPPVARKQRSRRMEPVAAGSKTARRGKAERQKNKASSDVVYTQPGTFNKGRFLLRLVTVVAVVLALVFGMSIFFKVDIDSVTISGAEKYSYDDIRNASGIQNGDNLITISKAKIAGRIIHNLPYVKSVRIGIKLPDTVNIEITELDVVYSVEAEDGSWWLMAADGRIIDRTNGASAAEYTKIIGVKLDKPAVGAQAHAAEPVPTETAADGSLIPVTVLGSERLNTVISIMQNLEEQGVLGEAVSIDVSDLTQIQLWYGSQFHVKLGDTGRLQYKIDYMKKAIVQMGPYHEPGILDVSFTMVANQAVFTKFSQ